MDFEKITIGTYKDGGTSTMATIVDLSLLSEECRKSILEKDLDNDSDLLSKFCIHNGLDPANIRIVKLTYPAAIHYNSDRYNRDKKIYFSHHKNDITFNDIADSILIKTIYDRMLKHKENLDPLNKYHYIAERNIDNWINWFKPLLRTYSLDYLTQ